MTIPNGYAQVRAANGESNQLPAGGYVCQILKAAPYTTKTGAEMFEISFDIADGEHKDHFKKKYNEAKGTNPKVVWGGVYRVFLTSKDGLASPFFKGLVTAIQDSNPRVPLIEGDTIHEEAMKGCLVGLLFRDEEFRGTDGAVRTTARPAMAVSVGRIMAGAYTIPKPRKLADQAGKFVQVEVEDNDLPF